MKKNKLINFLVMISVLGIIACKKNKEKKPTEPIIKTAVTKSIDCNNIPLVFEDLGEGIDYTVGCPILVRNQVITINPGVTIQFEGKNAGIEIGDEYGYTRGALKMIGTAAKPIVLQGKSAIAGSWKGLTLNGVNSENQWEHVTVRDAGGGEIPTGLFIRNLYDWKIQISIKNCSFINNLGYGISDNNSSISYSSNVFSAFEKNKFKDNTKSGIRLNIAYIGALDKESSYNDNGQNYIEVIGIRGPQYDVTLKRLNVPYLMTKDLELINKIIIEPGVTLQFAKGGGLSNMYYPETASIIANGTAELPIIFQGFEPNIKGYWRGIELNNLEPGVFNYCIIDGAGSLSSGSGCSGNVRSAIHFGAKCYAESGRGLVTNSSISNSGGHAITFQSGKNVMLGNNKYIGNTASDIHNY